MNEVKNAVTPYVEPAAEQVVPNVGPEVAAAGVKLHHEGEEHKQIEEQNSGIITVSGPTAPLESPNAHVIDLHPKTVQPQSGILEVVVKSVLSLPRFIRHNTVGLGSGNPDDPKRWQGVKEELKHAA